jgi:hypothetical protein
LQQEAQQSQESAAQQPASQHCARQQASSLHSQQHHGSLQQSFPNPGPQHPD